MKWKLNLINISENEKCWGRNNYDEHHKETSMSVGLKHVWKGKELMAIG